MKFQCYPYRLQFKNPFVLASGTRTFTPSVFLCAQQDGLSGWGEATMPPYVHETQQSVMQFIARLNLTPINNEQQLNSFFEYLYSMHGNYFAKAAVSNALLSWWTKKQHITLTQYFGLKTTEQLPDCCYTITKGDTVDEKLQQAKDFSLLKIKAGFDGDIDFIKTVAAMSSRAVCIDANRGWQNAGVALKKIKQLEGLNIEFIEQPLPTAMHDAMKILKQHSPFTLIADESFQTIGDLQNMAECFHGINIKLMKCGGVIQAYHIALQARNMGLKILLGCMSESSCGVAAAASIQSLMNWVDLDGPLLIKNDPFTGINYRQGKVVPGSNVEPIMSMLQQQTIA
ncbi:MAG: dipeptide epimerase [Bacteroidetes bacterium]|nr:dipeptide epimerase [Bacteroidetes bacterium CHB6]MCO5289641.1 dipeptide epimerase [Bacteroidota bacterium]